MTTAAYSSLPLLTFRTTPADVAHISTLRAVLEAQLGGVRVSTTDVIRAALALATKPRNGQRKPA